jgi:hypothetical protein
MPDREPRVENRVSDSPPPPFNNPDSPFSPFLARTLQRMPEGVAFFLMSAHRSSENTPRVGKRRHGSAFDLPDRRTR